MKKRTQIFVFGSVLMSFLIFCTMNLHRNQNEAHFLINGETQSLKNQDAAAQGIVDYFRELFNNDWELGTNYDFSEDGIGEPQSRELYGSGYEPFDPLEVEDDMKITPVLSPDNSEDLIIELIDSVNETLDIEQMYIYATLEEIIQAIVNAQQRGVLVRVIIADDEDSKGAVDVFQSNGISVKICTGKVPMYFTLHNKGVIVDGKVVLISSINWSPTSVRNNREAGLIIESNAVSAYYQTLFDHDWSVCEDYDDTEHLQSSLSICVTERTDPKGSVKVSTLQTQMFEGKMNATLMASPDNCFNTIAKYLSVAEISIDLSVYTFSSPYLLDILAERISHGVNVRLLLEKNQVGYLERKYNRWTMYNLTTMGIPSNSDPTQNLTADGLWSSEDFTYQHCKYCIIDNQRLILSSGNWARSSCPKPQPDGDVDGNRDWWIIIHGSGISGEPTEPEEPSDGNLIDDLLSISGSNPFLIIGIFGITLVILYSKKMYLINSTSKGTNEKS